MRGTGVERFCSALHMPRCLLWAYLMLHLTPCCPRRVPGSSRYASLTVSLWRRAGSYSVVDSSSFADHVADLASSPSRPSLHVAQSQPQASSSIVTAFGRFCPCDAGSLPRDALRAPVETADTADTALTTICLAGLASAPDVAQRHYTALGALPSDARSCRERIHINGYVHIIKTNISITV